MIFAQIRRLQASASENHAFESMEIIGVCLIVGFTDTPNVDAPVLTILPGTPPPYESGLNLYNKSDW